MVVNAPLLLLARIVALLAAESTRIMFGNVASPVVQWCEFSQIELRIATLQQMTCLLLDVSDWSGTFSNNHACGRLLYHWQPRLFALFQPCLALRIEVVMLPSHMLLHLLLRALHFSWTTRASAQNHLEQA